MSEVYFYHLTRSALEQALPDLLEKVRANNWRALVRGVTQERLIALDRSLWSYRDDSFLVHGMAGNLYDAEQPVLLTDKDGNPNRAEILLLIHGAKTQVEEISQFTRVCLMFDGNDPEQLSHARSDWKTLTDVGVKAQYWAQEDGRWMKKAEKG